MDDSHRGVIGASIVAGFLLVLFCAQGAWLGARVLFDLGVPGNYVIGEGFSCSKRAGCSSPHGTFTSDDGKVTREDVRLDGRTGPELRQGSVVRAYDVGAHEAVYGPEARRNYEGLVVLTLWGVGLVAVVFGSGYLWLTRK
ncbi:hypothetical protein AB0E59_22725 [Lentzea sp. NPDC034063]|uniref:hypothetical protein n=1 Tax=unclassified Lentzea TaxID=2643253 RepID=UPI0033CC6EFF